MVSILKAFVVIYTLLLLGDFISTFLYHVPEHVFGKFHILVHHGKDRNFFHYAVLSRNPLVLLDGIAGAIPYFIFIPWFWQISVPGTIIGLILGEFHVVWRHVSIMNWKTPKVVKGFCKLLSITTPERHWLHHKNARLAYGDIFTFLDPPAQSWFLFLGKIKRKYIQQRKQQLS